MNRVLKFILFTFLAIIIAFIIIGGGFGDKPNHFLNNGQVTVFAHKGNTEYEVANSIPAFECSAEIGFTANEIDINSTKDGKLILLHDDTCNRLLGIDFKIKAIEWDSIKETKLLFDWRPTEYTVASLASFLQFYNPEQLVYMDIKEATKNIADSLLHTLRIHKEPKNVLIASSNLLFLNYIKIKKPEIKTVLEGFGIGKEWIYYLLPKNFKPDFYASYLKEVDEKHMDFLKNNKLLNKKIVYGIDKQNISRVYKLGIQNIILEYTDTLGSLAEIKQKLELNKLR